MLLLLLLLLTKLGEVRLKIRSNLEGLREEMCPSLLYLGSVRRFPSWLPIFCGVVCGPMATRICQVRSWQHLHQPCVAGMVSFTLYYLGFASGCPSSHTASALCGWTSGIFSLSLSLSLSLSGWPRLTQLYVAGKVHCFLFFPSHSCGYRRAVEAATEAVYHLSGHTGLMQVLP